MKRVTNRRRLAGVTSALYLLGVAVLLTAMSAFGQTIQLSQAAESESAEPAGAYLGISQLPRPEWHQESGVPVARLRFAAPNTAAWSVVFESLYLGKDAQMYLVGISATGALSAVHGPYERNGPLNVPGFETRIIEGADLVIEVRGGSDLSAWPFTIESLKRIGPAHLAILKKQGMEVEAFHQPRKRERHASEVRHAWFEDQLVPYRVIDGMAIVGGDIVLGPAAEVESGNVGKSDRRREAHEDTRSSIVWPTGVIPYTIEYTPALWPGHTMETRILGAIAHLNERFPGILVKRTTQTDYVTFRLDSKSDACYSQYGRIGGQQFITLNMGCTRGSIIHEIAHALGMWHEHQRPDRDEWLTIHWQNIDPDFAYAFEIPKSATRPVGAYDLGSIMHYGRRTASVDPWTKDTFSLKVQPPEGVAVGQNTALSTGDVAAIRARYCNVANWKISPASFLADGNGGSYTLAVTAPPYCTWTATESVSWISVPAGTKTGSASITFTVFANFGPDRAANIKVQSGTTSKLVRVDQPLDPHNIN